MLRHGCFELMAPVQPQINRKRMIYLRALGEPCRTYPLIYPRKAEHAGRVRDLGATLPRVNDSTKAAAGEKARQDLAIENGQLRQGIDLLEEAIRGKQASA